MSYDVSTDDDGKHAIVTERQGGTFVVTINRPEVRNALDGPTASALAQAFREFDSDDTLAVAVLSGSGETFCSGFDLKAVADATRMLRVSEEGDAVAGGLEVALWCDLRVAAENAIFGVFNR